MRRLLAVTVCAVVAAGAAAAAPPHARVSVRTTPLGSVLADARGHTLYVYDRDTAAGSRCSGACASLWPPFLTGGRPVALAGVRASLVGTTKRGDGRLQVTFKGHPLYFFARDVKAGQVNGAGIAHWAALSAAGTKLRATSTGGTATTTTPVDTGGGGYGGGGYGDYGP
jgi:predicted lipoprotein with Yx(FWY)xxD motif